MVELLQNTRPRVAIVGAGPAGLMAASILAPHCHVEIFEHRRSAGRKFLLAGRGGLNITHSEPVNELLDRYGPERSLLEGAMASFGPSELRAWCAAHGEATFVGTSGRVFPKSLRATPLLRSWLRELEGHGVALNTGHLWTGWDRSGALEFTKSRDGQERTRVVMADATLFALGGASWPRVSSDGSWAVTFADAEIQIRPLMAANCGVVLNWSTVLRDRFGGEPIKNAVFTVGDTAVRGDAVITTSGLEGGPIYAHSRLIRETLEAQESVTVHVDLQPDLSREALHARLSKRRPKASASSWLNSAGIAAPAVALLRESTNNVLPTDPHAVALLLKALPLTVTGLTSIDRAISTAGGIDLAEIDDTFMLHKKPGTFVAGEMLNWEAPTGGYLLQACFSTGVAAARGVLTWLERR